MNLDALHEVNYEVSICDELVSVNREIKELQERQKKLQEELKDLRPTGGKKYGIDMKQKERKGSVDLPWLCKAYNIEDDAVELFRKPSVTYWEFRNY